ncbi:hypothetical protein [Clostridium sp. DL1XJH146]
MNKKDCRNCLNSYVVEGEMLCLAFNESSDCEDFLDKKIEENKGLAIKTQIENQQENIQKLIKLSKENPNLKIIPMVSSEVVQGDDFCCWTGDWSSADLDRCWIDEERIYFESTDREDLIDKYVDKYDEGHPTNEEEISRWAEEQVRNLPWEKVITVYINSL